MITRFLALLTSAPMLIACIADPIYSIKHTVGVDGTLSHECIKAAADSLQDASISQADNPSDGRDFDEYFLSNSEAEIQVLWFRNDRTKLELSTLGIGYADKKRDFNTCGLIQAFTDSLVDVCRLDRDKITIKEEYVRSKCHD